MQKLDYKGSLKSDIHNVLIRDKKSDIIVKSSVLGVVINIPIVVGTIILSMVDISNSSILIPSACALTTLLDSYLFIGRPVRKIGLRKKNANDSEERIDTLSKSIVAPTFGKETNFMPNITDKDSLIESIQIENNDKQDSLEKIVTDFYSLDNKDRLLVLREVRSKFTNGIFKDSDEVCELFMLDDVDLPDELPVVRRLEVTNNERN